MLPLENEATLTEARAALVASLRTADDDERRHTQLLAEISVAEYTYKQFFRFYVLNFMCFASIVRQQRKEKLAQKKRDALAVEYGALTELQKV